jgi:asparagine synthetase B (glutamine-hydrolysing)
MLQAVPHRGREQRTLTVGRATIGIVTREDGAGAAIDASDGFVAAVTGPIDNRRDIERALHSRGGVPEGCSAARLLIELFRAFGLESPRLLRGAFAAVITDGQQLVCFRDHVGFASLFFRHDARGVYVASEAKQVVAGAGIRKQPDLEVVEQIFYQSYDDATPCALHGVERVPKMTVLAFERDRVRRSPYWNPEALLEAGDVSAAELPEAFADRMTQAAARMVTEHCAVSLSGGIDSPAVAAFAAPRYLDLTGNRLPCLTAVYPDHPSVDEREYTELVADKLDVPLHEYQQHTPNLDRLAEWMQLVDGPVPAISLPFYEEHYREVRSLGATTVLSGELAEFVVDTSSYLLPHLLMHGRFGALNHQLRSRRARGHSYPAIARQLVTPFVPSPIVRWRIHRDPAHIPSWIDRRRANEAAVRSVVGPAHRWRTLQLAAFDGPGISAEAEQICQQVSGVQARRPWTDIDLWELFLGLPAEIKFPNHQRKGLVRTLLRGRVPDEILDRKDKTLFNDSIMSSIDYAELQRWLGAPPWRLPGVDYRALGDLLDRRALDLPGFLWAKDLASTHAFLSQW